MKDGKDSLDTEPESLYRSKTKAYLESTTKDLTEVTKDDDVVAMSHGVAQLGETSIHPEGVSDSAAAVAAEAVY